MPLPYACPMQYQGPVPAVCTIPVPPAMRKNRARPGSGHHYRHTIGL